MELLGYLALGALLLVTIIVMIASVVIGVMRQRRTVAHWTRPDLAGALGIPSAGTDGYAGVRAGMQVRFGYTRTQTFGGAGGPAYPFWADVEIAPPLPLSLDIRPRTAPGGVPIGWPDFDARYVVFSPDIPTAQRLLPPELMTQFLSLAAYGGVTLTRDRVKFWTDESWTDPARIAWLLDSMIALSRQLSARVQIR
jgi:hypothetical protein